MWSYLFLGFGILRCQTSVGVSWCGVNGAWYIQKWSSINDYFDLKQADLQESKHQFKKRKRTKRQRYCLKGIRLTVNATILAFLGLAGFAIYQATKWSIDVSSVSLCIYFLLNQCLFSEFHFSRELFKNASGWSTIGSDRYTQERFKYQRVEIKMLCFGPVPFFKIAKGNRPETSYIYLLIGTGIFLLLFCIVFTLYN